MRLTLAKIPGLDDQPGRQWRVRALSIDSKNRALSAIIQWEDRETKNYRKIIRSLLYAAANQIGDCTPNNVKKCNHPNYGDIYEARADKLHARMMFFYDLDKKLIICTNEFWKKTSGDKQDTAFKHCGMMKQIYEQNSIEDEI